MIMMISIVAAIILYTIGVYVFAMSDYKSENKHIDKFLFCLSLPGYIVISILFVTIFLLWALICVIMRRCAFCFNRKKYCICEGLTEW